MINLQNISEKIAEKLTGKIFCPGEDCNAPLYMVHNPRDGGKTIFFRATNEDHIDSCIYKNENYVGGRPGVSLFNGYYTEGQINDYVRNLFKDLHRTPDEKPKNVKNGPRNAKGTSGTDERKATIRGGRIVSGNEYEIEGNKGRMSRRYSVSESDIGAQIGIYGNIKELYLDNYGQVRIRFIEERNSNIEILIGQVYKNFNPQAFEYLDKVKRYYEKLIADNKTVELVAGGLVVKYNEQLTVELQAKYSFRINGHTILDIIRENV